MSTTDQDSEETTEEETEEETSEEETEEESKEQSKETDITAAETHKLVKAIQKGYTITRQDMAKMKENQEAVQASLDKLASKEDEFDGEEPLTVDKFLKLQKEQAKVKDAETQKINDRISESLDNLKAEGVISTKDEEDSLLKYAVKHKITDLNRAASQWKEWYDLASKTKAKKNKAKIDKRKKAGKKVGTSKKTQVESVSGVDYSEIRNKSIDEIADEE